MPRAKKAKNSGQKKTISCPHCGKKFSTETNVLQHLNQPTGSCFGLALFQELEELPNIGSISTMTQEAQENPPHEGYREGSSVASDDLDADMYDFPPDPPDDPPHARVQPERLAEERFVETFPGCAECFPGGKTFMDRFREDQFAEQRRTNIYYPWASKQEWQFASWLIRSRLSMAAIDDLLSLDIIKNLSLSFHSAKELRNRTEILPRGPQWVCETLRPEYPVKQPLRLFYRSPIECLQALLSHPLFADHISFVPRRVWTSAARICRIYDEWLSGDRAWDMQAALPPGSTLLGVVLSSDKTNISIMSGNRVAHPVLISLANIDARIRCKASLHAYLLLGLLPIAKFSHKTTRVRGLLQDRLVHEALNIILAPLKTAAKVGIMMSDPAGNLRYCFTPIAAYIADTPEESLLAATSSRVSPVTTASAKNFGDPHRHPPRTGTGTLRAIRVACSKHSPADFKNFLKIIKTLGLNGVTVPFWMGWGLSDPPNFITPEPLHHFHRFFWDHDVKWCIVVVGAEELDYRFSLIQTLVGYRAFDEGISRLKQVTGRDHRAIQRYIIGIVAGSVPRTFLVALRALLDFRYLAQAPKFTTDTLDRVAGALQEFHENKHAIVRHGARNGWEIPKLELLQSVAPSIRQSGAVMQWSADITEHAHVEEIKVPARASNNQNYFSQIARHLDRLDKCFRFDLATFIEENQCEDQSADEVLTDEDEDHEPDAEKRSLAEYSTPTRSIPDYFSAASALLRLSNPSVTRPLHTFATTTTAFHLAIKPSSSSSIAEAAIAYGLPDLFPAICAFYREHRNGSIPGDHVKLQIWHKVRLQQMSYHDKTLEPPQTLRAIPPSSTNDFGQYDAVIYNTQFESEWPKSGLEGHSVAQLRIIFRPYQSDFFAAYVQKFLVVPQSNPTNVNSATGMHLLRRVTQANGQRVGKVIPLNFMRSPVHLIPHFDSGANPRLTKLSSYELSTEFWLNKYWSKELYYSLSP